MLLPFGIEGYTIAISVVAIMIAISSFFLGLGYALNSKKFKEFGLDELTASLVNGVLVGGLMLLFASNGIISNLITTLTLNNGVSMSCQQYMQDNIAICFAYNYLSGSGYTYMGIYHPSILSIIMDLLTAFFSLNAILGLIGSLGVSIFGFTLSFGSVVAPLLNTMQYFIKYLVTMAIGTLVQSSVLSFVAVTAITVILPTGLILRTFYPTRKIGGFLLALAIGTYVVLPLSYVLDAFTASTYLANVNSTGINATIVNATNIKNTILGINTQNKQSLGIISSIISSLSALSSSLSSIANYVLGVISYLIVYVFILPAFSLVLTAISIRELSRLFSSEVNFWILDIL